MRHHLLAASALAPLLLAAHVSAAWAETTISSSTSGALATSTAASGSPDDLTIASGVTVSPTSGAAVTVDSDNSVVNNGAITMNSAADGSAAILIGAGRTGSVTSTGAITITDGYTATDTLNSDGIVEAPFATGTSRYGIHALGALNGSITNTGTISVKGNQSYGLSLDGALSGSLLSTGTITLAGDNGSAVRIAGPIGGAAQFSGAISATGQNTTGVAVNGDIAGRLSFYSTVTATGYTTTARTTSTTALAKIQATAEDVQQGGSAVSVQSNVGGGIFIGAPPSGTVSTSTADVDGDGVADGVEGTGAITSYGSAPALQIGGAAPITIGPIGSGDNAYGLIIRGSVTGAGLYDGYSATALDIGAGGGGVTFVGGVRILGTVSATTYQADATAIHLRSGAVLPSLRNEGTISAIGTSAVASNITALQIDSGASLTSLVNYATLSSTVTGNLASVTAVKDASGSINFVENTGAIKAVITPATANAVTSGKTVALDLSANTSGIFLHQELNGTVSPSIVGDVLLGSGTNTVQLLSGTVAGALDLGSGQGGSLLIAGGATYLGPLSYTGSGLAISVQSGSLETTKASVINGSSLAVGSGGTLILAVDPVNNAASQLNLTGSATLAPGAKLGVRFLSALSSETTYTLVKASSLSVADGSLLSVTTPYLFAATATADTTANTISVQARRRTAAEMGLNASESAALPAVYAALSQDSGVQSAILAANDRATFVKTYGQLLPDHSGDVFRVVSQMSEAAGRAASERRSTSGGYWNSGGAAWLEEVAIGAKQQKGAGEAYQSTGLGLIGGFEATGQGNAVGLSIAGSSSNVDQAVRASSSNLSVNTLEGSLYWNADWGGLLADARVGAGYVSVKSVRALTATVDTTSIQRSASGDWNGYDLSARLGLGYEAQFGRLSLTPRAHVDMLRLTEHGYSEAGGGDGYDLVVQDRDAHSVTATTSVTAGANFGESFVWRPTVEVGYKTVLDGDAGATTARFAYGGDSFTLTPNSLKGGAAIVRLAMTGAGSFGNFSVEAGGESGKDYSSEQLRANFRFPF